MSEKLGLNKLAKNGRVTVPPEVQEIMDLVKGEDLIGFKKCKKEEGVKIVQAEGDY